MTQHLHSYIYILNRNENVCPQKIEYKCYSGIIFNSQKNRNNLNKHLSTDKWISKMWHIHTTACFSAIRRNEVFKHATIWMNLEKNSDTKGFHFIEMASCCMIPFIQNVQSRQIYDRNLVMVAQGLDGEGNWGKVVSLLMSLFKVIKTF